MKNIILIFAFITITTSCTAQKQETIYLLFKTDSLGTCNYSKYKDGSDKKELSFKYKKSKVYQKKIRFKICNQYFEFNPDFQTKKVISKNDIKTANIDYLLNKWKENPFDREKEIKQIYILEDLNNLEYLQYEVKWADLYF